MLTIASDRWNKYSSILSTTNAEQIIRSLRSSCEAAYECSPESTVIIHNPETISNCKLKIIGKSTVELGPDVRLYGEITIETSTVKLYDKCILEKVSIIDSIVELHNDSFIDLCKIFHSVIKMSETIFIHAFSISCSQFDNCAKLTISNPLVTININIINSVLSTKTPLVILFEGRFWYGEKTINLILPMTIGENCSVYLYREYNTNGWITVNAADNTYTQYMEYTSSWNQNKHEVKINNEGVFKCVRRSPWYRYNSIINCDFTVKPNAKLELILEYKGTISKVLAEDGSCNSIRINKPIDIIYIDKNSVNEKQDLYERRKKVII